MEPEISDDEALNLTGQEARCIALACGYLSQQYGGVWRVMHSLDAQHPSEPSPEVLVGNGCMTAAIEVKRLTGDSLWQAYEESILSLERFLAPTCGGLYSLIAPAGSLPMVLKLKRHIRGEIERVAPTLAVGESGAVRVPRQGSLELRSRSGPPSIWCLHTTCGHRCLLEPLVHRIPEGSFFLCDCGPEGHSFVTEEGRKAFYEAVAAACRACLLGGDAPVTWHEEWELRKVKDDGKGVWIMAATGAREPKVSVAECVNDMVEKARKKFSARRWADLQVVVFESSIHTPEPWVSAAIARLEPEELKGIDLLLLVDGESCRSLYSSPTG